MGGVRSLRRYRTAWQTPGWGNEMTTKSGASLEELERRWPGMELPGYRDHVAGPATYSTFKTDALPVISRDLDDNLLWLCAEPVAPSSLAEATTPPPCRAATPEQLGELLGTSSITPPASFLNFIKSAEPRKRIRSATDCYLDLAETVVPVSTGGILIHFLSDSQFCFHWLLYVGANGEEAVVATREPFGFVHPDYWSEGARIPPAFAPGEEPDAFVCANSFSEFLYRFWIENEIWYRLAWEHHSLSGEQQQYVSFYRTAALPGSRGPSRAKASATQPLLTRILRRLRL